MREGYYSEQCRDDAFLKMLFDSEKLNNQCKLIVTRLRFAGPQTMQELEEFLGIPVHLVSARLNFLRKEGIVYNPMEWITDKKTGEQKQAPKRRLNPVTHIRNTLWALEENKQLKIF